MDQLKHFIDTPRDAFEDDRLPAGHLERFEKKVSPCCFLSNYIRQVRSSKEPKHPVVC